MSIGSFPFVARKKQTSYAFRLRLFPPGTSSPCLRANKAQDRPFRSIKPSLGDELEALGGARDVS